MSSLLWSFRRRAVRSAVVLLPALSLIALTGCQALTPRGPNEIDPLSIETRDDITQVVAYWPKTTWTYDADGNPKGIRPAVYFVSGQTQKGAFVPGQIRITLSEVLESESAAAGAHAALKPLHEWRFDANTHRSFRIAKKAITGYYYGFPLDLPDGVTLAGKEAEIVIAYRRADGREIESTPKRDRALALRWPRQSPVHSASSRRPAAPPVRETDAPLEPADGYAQAAPSSAENAPAPAPPAPSKRTIFPPPGESDGQRPNVYRFRPVQAGSR